MLNIAGTRCQYRRLHQIAKLYLYAPSSGMFSCPLAMTDGAASILTSQVRNGRYKLLPGVNILAQILKLFPYKVWNFSSFSL